MGQILMPCSEASHIPAVASSLSRAGEHLRSIRLSATCPKKACSSRNGAQADQVDDGFSDVDGSKLGMATGCVPPIGRGGMQAGSLPGHHRSRGSAAGARASSRGALPKELSATAATLQELGVTETVTMALSPTLLALVGNGREAQIASQSPMMGQ